MGSIKLKTNLQKFSFQEKPGYVTRVVHYNRINGNDLLEFAAEHSDMSVAQLAASMYAIVGAFKTFLLNGHSVELPKVGSFRFGVRAKAVDTESEAGAQTVYRRRIIFTPSTGLRNSLLNTNLTATEKGSAAGGGTETPKTPVEDENNG